VFRHAKWGGFAIILYLMAMDLAKGQVNDTCTGAIALASGVAVTNSTTTA
jgi:hypothetical protein